MATRRGVEDYKKIQGYAENRDDIEVLNRAIKAENGDPNGLVGKVNKLSVELSHDGSEGDALYQKVAKRMMADGLGSPRDAFPEIYADILEERNRLIEQQKEAFDQAQATPEEREDWVAGQQYQEVDKDYRPGELTRENLSRLPEHQAAAEQRMGGIVQRLAKRAMDKVVDTMVAFDSTIDAVAAKSKSMWSSVTDAIKSKKTKMAALAATAIVAAGLTGNPAQAADLSQADVPTTHAEMTQSMHEARADHMEQQLKQEAMDKFSSHLQSVKAEAVEEFSAGLDEAIEAAEKQFEYSYHILHNPAFQDAALSNPEVQDALMDNDTVRNVVRYSPATQNLMDDMSLNDGIMQKLLEDEEIRHRVTELHTYKRMMSSKMGVDAKALEDNGFMSRSIDMPGVKDIVLQDDLVKLDMMTDEQIQDRVLKDPAVRAMAFSAPETKERVLGISGIDHVLDTPDMEKRVMQDVGEEMSLNLPEEEKAPEIVHMPVEEKAPEIVHMTEERQAPRLNITQAELDQLASSPSAKAPELNLPDQAERELVNLQPQKEHKLNLPEQEERELVHLQPPTERHFNADFKKRLEADTISYNDLSKLMFSPDFYTNVHFSPPPTSNMDAEIDAHSIKVLVERQGVEFGQFMGVIEKNAPPEVVSTVKQLVESADIEWDTSRYDKDKDPNHFVLKMDQAPDEEKRRELPEGYVSYGAHG